MALSNWATLALNLDGKRIDTVGTEWPVSKLGVRIEIYKNWLYVSDAKAWRDGGTYVEPIVMQINHGELNYLDWHIVAVRGPQQGVFVVATTRDGDKLTGFVGCGVYGYDDHRWVGVEPLTSFKFLKAWVTAKEQQLTKAEIEHMWGREASQEEYDKLIAELGESHTFPKEVAGISWENAADVCQGAAFFARNIPKMGEPGFDPEKAR